MNPVGYLAIRERGYRAIFLADAEARAIDEAAKHHGHVGAVVLKEGVIELVRPAKRGRHRGQTACPAPR